MLIALLAGLVIVVCGLAMILLHALCLVAGRADERNRRAYEALYPEDEDEAGN